MGSVTFERAIEPSRLSRPTYHVEDEVFEGGMLLRLSESGFSSCDDGSADVICAHNFVVPRVFRPVMSQVAGWVFDEDVLYAPMPERFMMFTSAAEIPVRLIEDTIQFGVKIPALVYGQTVLDGMHPAGVEDIAFWLHDISIDHFLAAVISGQELFDVLVDDGISRSSHKDMVSLAGRYDTSTMIILDACSAYLTSKTNEGPPQEILCEPYRTRIEKDVKWAGGATAATMAADKIERLTRLGLEGLELL